MLDPVVGLKTSLNRKRNLENFKTKRYTKGVRKSYPTSILKKSPVWKWEIKNVLSTSNINTCKEEIFLIEPLLNYQKEDQHGKSEDHK